MAQAIWIIMEISVAQGNPIILKCFNELKMSIDYLSIIGDYGSIMIVVLKLRNLFDQIIDLNSLSFACLIPKWRFTSCFGGRDESGLDLSIFEKQTFVVFVFLNVVWADSTENVVGEKLSTKENTDFVCNEDTDKHEDSELLGIANVSNTSAGNDSLHSNLKHVFGSHDVYEEKGVLSDFTELSHMTKESLYTSEYNSYIASSGGVLVKDSSVLFIIESNDFLDDYAASCYVTKESLGTNSIKYPGSYLGLNGIMKNSFSVAQLVNENVVTIVVPSKYSEDVASAAHLEDIASIALIESGTSTEITLFGKNGVSGASIRDYISAHTTSEKNIASVVHLEDIASKTDMNYVPATRLTSSSEWYKTRTEECDAYVNASDWNLIAQESTEQETGLTVTLMDYALTDLLPSAGSLLSKQHVHNVVSKVKAIMQHPRRNNAIYYSSFKQ